MDRFLIAILLSYFSLAFYCNGWQKGFETQKAQTIALLKAQLALAEQAKTAADLRSLLSDGSAKKNQEQKEQLKEKTQGEKSPTHRQLSVRGKKVKLFHDGNTLRLLVGKYNDRLCTKPFLPNQLMVLEVDQTNRKENVVASAPLAGYLERMELYTDAQGPKVRTEINGKACYKEFDALTLKCLDEDEVDSFTSKKLDWGDYGTVHGLFFSLWHNQQSRHERHIVSTIGGKKKRITMPVFDPGVLNIVDVATGKSEFTQNNFLPRPVKCTGRVTTFIHVFDKQSNVTPSASAAHEGTATAASTAVVTKRSEGTVIVFAGNDFEFTRKAGAPSEEAYLKQGHSAFNYLHDWNKRKNFLLIDILDLQTQKTEEHVIPDVQVCCSARFPNNEGSQIIFACETDKEKQVYKLVVFDPVTKTHKLFEKVDPLLYTYEFQPEDISCVKTPEGKNLVALARGPDIFMIDLN